MLTTLCDIITQGLSLLAMAWFNHTLPACKCFRCGHVWVPKLPARPLSCPKCRSHEWDRKKPSGRGWHREKRES